MTDSKCKCEEKTEKEVCTDEKVEIEEEKHKAPSIPEVAKFKRPPAFERGNNSFARGNQNNFQQVQRRAAQRGR
ncbi:hypothetical protein EOM39_05110 [Candidatus Gracilibacteria bacterium]|nr:hypothetical protein [Candidatus Gracilibacteria bacterium]